VLQLVCTLQVMVDQIRQLEAEIAQALRAHPDGEIFQSFFRNPESVICAATLLGEIGDSRHRYSHRDAIAADSGQARSRSNRANTKNAKFRWACNKRLRKAFGVPAQSSTRSNAWAADRYASARARGHNHQRALRTLGRAWSQIIWRCWQTHTPYDPKRHTGPQQHITVTIPTPSAPRPDTLAPQRIAASAVTHTARNSSRLTADHPQG
jgi:transposase